jgi:hypothetical protein
VKRLQILFMFTALYFLFASSTSAQAPNNWVGIGLGFTGLEIDIGRYNLFASNISGRALMGWPFGPGFNIGTDVLWIPEATTDFYLGAGLRLRGDFAGSDSVWFGPALSLGYDVSLSSKDDLYINAGTGLLFPIYFREQFPEADDITVMTSIVSLELGFGYKYKF